MNLRKAVLLVLVAGLATPALLLARQNLLKNGSVEFGQGAGAIDPQVADEWTEFGINVERSPTVNLAPPGDGHALKAFGDSDSSSVGAFQQVGSVSPGQSVVASVYVHTPSFDRLGGTGQAGLVLEFLDFFGGTIGTPTQLYVLDSASPPDTWIPAVIGPLTAPSGTTSVRVTCRLIWTPPTISGAAYWDDAQLTVNGGPNKLLNGDFETAGPSQGQSPVGIDDWMGFNDQEKSDDVAEHGDFSLKLGVREAYSGLFQNMRTLYAGDHIYLLAYAYNPSSAPLTGSTRVGIKLEFDPSTEVPPPVENLPFDENAPEDTWTLVELVTTVPDDATIARLVCINAANAQTTGAVHFDGAYAERSSAPGVNQLFFTNWSFEDGSGSSLDYWTTFDSSGVSSAAKSCFEVPAYDGICTARTAGSAVAGVWQEIIVAPAETLTFRAYLYTPNYEPLTGPGLAGLKVEWAVGGVPEDVDIGGPTNTIDAAAPQDTWIPLYIDYTMPADTSAIARFTNLIEKGTAVTGQVYMDSCEAVLLNRFDGSDVDGDDDQDLIDAGWFQRCFTGAGAGGLPFNGIVFDSNDDLDVDFADFGYFATRMTGPQ